MSEVFPLFICCKTGALTFDILRDERFHWHTAGFLKEKVISKEMRKSAVEGQPEWKKLCEGKK